MPTQRDPDSLKAAKNSARRIRLMIKAKLSPGASLCSICRHGENRRWHDSVSVASGNFLAAKVIFLSSKFKHMFPCDDYCCKSSHEVATACALTLGAEKLICIVDSPILDEWGRSIRFLTLEDADIVKVNR
ncbi:hypothetical protein L2E82_29683 [Cichorium intybus]|uniref:Uncharacterized protein n=1 Tax=Cichorium intybus TaxID=13427 RepID=A0ACB9CY72_CICIN|nr:hypothetical protein L2E82_29683 [Cichorium intybus]